MSTRNAYEKVIIYVALSFSLLTCPEELLGQDKGSLILSVFLSPSYPVFQRVMECVGCKCSQLPEIVRMC